jgi:hypothetical protein
MTVRDDLLETVSTLSPDDPDMARQRRRRDCSPRQSADRPPYGRGNPRSAILSRSPHAAYFAKPMVSLTVKWVRRPDSLESRSGDGGSVASHDDPPHGRRDGGRELRCGTDPLICYRTRISGETLCRYRNLCVHSSCSPTLCRAGSRSAAGAQHVRRVAFGSADVSRRLPSRPWLRTYGGR